MKKRMVFLAALALCAGLLCGCGDGSPASGTESTPAETSLPESQASLAGNQDGEESGAGGVPRHTWRFPPGAAMYRRPGAPTAGQF